MVNWLIHAALLTVVTVGGPEPGAKVAVRQIRQIEISETQRKMLEMVPEIYATVEVTAENVVSPKRGNSLFRAPNGALLVVRGHTREQELYFADSGWLQRPNPNDPNSPWVMASCNCANQKDDECTLLRDDNGELAVVDGTLQCNGPDCCEIRIYGVDGSGRTFMERG